MPVKGVELVDFHNIKISLDSIYVKEMTGNIHVHTSVAESRRVVDLAAWDSPVCVSSNSLAVDFCREHLLDSLNCVIEAVKRRCRDLYSLFADLD